MCKTQASANPTGTRPRVEAELQTGFVIGHSSQNNGYHASNSGGKRKLQKLLKPWLDSNRIEGLAVTS
jgi:hypothetical protein